MAGTDRGHILLRTFRGGAGPGVLVRAEGRSAASFARPGVCLAQVPILVFLGLLHRARGRRCFTANRFIPGSFTNFY
jgi:hypothetical protein